MEIFMEYIVFFVPIIVLSLGLTIAAVVHAVRHPHYKFGNMFIWLAIILLFQTIGPILYFIIGRGERE